MKGELRGYSKSLVCLVQKHFYYVLLAVVLYGCETWSLTLRDEPRLRVFENRVLRGIFGRKRDEVIGGWRKLHNEKLRQV
jgi:hypothetical protein